jgi:hypothetical protein
MPGERKGVMLYAAKALCLFLVACTVIIETIAMAVLWVLAILAGILKALGPETASFIAIIALFLMWR